MIFLWLAALAIFAGASITLATIEAAFYQVKRRALRALPHSPALGRLDEYLDDPPALLMPAHIGTYTAHVAMTVILTSLLLDLLRHWTMVVTLVSMVLYLLIFRLTLPYAIARRSPERVLLVLIRPFHRYARLIAPLTQVLRRRAGGTRVENGSDHAENGQSTKPLAAPAEIPPPPILDTNESRLMDSLARFSHTQAREVMTPRLDIAAIGATSTVREALQAFRDSQHSRLVVSGENLDDIRGTLTIRDTVIYNGPPDAPITTLVRPAPVVPETKKIVDLLRDLQQRRTTLALTVDEYGGTSGLVSMEDIVEELVGEIKDEYDNETEPLIGGADGSITSLARVSLDKLKDALESPFAMPEDVDTVGGLVMKVFGRVPRPGESIRHEGYDIEVLDATAKRIERVKFQRVSS
jgi:CBS domain containing-hemolysin-like protein